MINQFECRSDRKRDKVRFNAVKKKETRKKGRKGRNELSAFEILEAETENVANRYVRVHDPLRRYMLHDETEIANNDATEQYAPLTLICIKSVRIVSISNAVYTWLTVS